MSTLLEERYRRALRILPAPYRRAWEEDMVATFLETAYAADPDDPEGVGLGSPGTGELASIAGLAVRLRLGGVGAAPRQFLWGEAVRRVALIGLLVHTTGTLVGVLFMLWLTQDLPGLSLPGDAPPSGFTDRWRALWSLTGLLWLPAYLAVIHGHHRLARTLAVLALTPELLSTVATVAIGDGAFALSHSYRLLFDAVPVLALAAFHATAPAMRPRPWLLALPVGVGITFAVFFLFLYSGMPGSGPALQTALDWPGLWCVGLAAAGLAHLAAASTGRSPAPSWTLALAGLAALVLGLRLTTLVDHLAFTAATPERTTSAIIAGAQAAAALGTGLALAVVAARRVRRTPTAPGSPTPADTGAAR